MWQARLDPKAWKPPTQWVDLSAFEFDAYAVLNN